jgi:hypothetical protein
MKRRNLLCVALALLLCLIGCEQTKTAAYEDLMGEWSFPSSTKNHSTSIMLSDYEPIIPMLDIRWDEETESLVYQVEGSYDQGIFSGSYWLSADSTTQWTIDILLSLTSDKLSMSCSGNGPLDGLNLSNGVRL